MGDLLEDKAAKEAAKAAAEEEQRIAKLEIQNKIHEDMDLFLDIPMTVTTQLGHTDMKVRDIVKLNVGSVVELNKLVGEPMEIFINGLMVARGEVVVVNEKFGVRVTDVVNEFEVRRIATTKE